MGAYIAIVSSIETLDDDGNPATARVLPNIAGGVVTVPFAIYWPMRAGDGAIKEGDEVICLQFEDGTGLVLCRPDGTWTKTIGGTAHVQTDITAGSGRVSLAGHKHQGVHGDTSPPTT